MLRSIVVTFVVLKRFSRCKQQPRQSEAVCEMFITNEADIPVSRSRSAKIRSSRTQSMRLEKLASKQAERETLRYYLSVTLIGAFFGLTCLFVNQYRASSSQQQLPTYEARELPFAKKRVHQPDEIDMRVDEQSISGERSVGDNRLGLLQTKIRNLRENIATEKIIYYDLNLYRAPTNELFYVSPHRMNWLEAQELCQSMASSLVSWTVSESHVKQYLQTTLFPVYRGKSLWSGLNYSSSSTSCDEVIDGSSEDHLSDSSVADFSAKCTAFTTTEPRILQDQPCESKRFAFCFDDPNPQHYEVQCQQCLKNHPAKDEC